MKKFLVQTFKEYFSHSPLSLSAALSFYAVIAFPAFVILLLFFSTLFVSQKSLSPEMYTQIEIFLGPSAKTLITQIYTNLPPLREIKLASIVTLLTFLFGGIGFFDQLQGAIHQFWGIALKPKLGIKGYLKNQLFLASAMISSGALFLASTAIEISFSSIAHLLPKMSLLKTLFPIFGFLLSVILVITTFTFLYKFLTQSNVGWKESIFGAFITTILFTIGKYIAMILLSHNATLTSYGTTSAIIIFLLFVYYSSQAIFLGAISTKIYAEKIGHKIRPNKNATDTKSLWNRLTQN